MLIKIHPRVDGYGDHDDGTGDDDDDGDVIDSEFSHFHFASFSGRA